MTVQKNVYLDDTYLTRVETRVIGSGRDAGGHWINVAENIAHPQGGGQPADRVRVAGSPATVQRDRAGDGAVRLYVGAPPEAETVELEVDRARRLTHAALHTGGHLLHWVLQEFGWLARRGHHFPGESRVEFGAMPDREPAPWDGIAAEVEARCQALLANALPVSAWQEGGLRMTRIGDTETVPCAGTHVRDLGRIAGFRLTGGKVKKGVLKIGYNAGHAPE